MGEAIQERDSVRVEDAADLEEHVIWPSTLTDCLERYRRKRLEGEDYGTFTHLIEGRALDEAATADLRKFIEKGEYEPLDSLTDVARDSVYRSWPRVLLTVEEKARGETIIRDETVERAVKLEKVHHAELAPKLRPLGVQEKFSIRWPVKEGDKLQIILRGKWDVRERDSIRDLKRKKRKPKQEDIHNNPAMDAYALGHRQEHGRYPAVLGLDSIVAYKRERPQLVMIERKFAGKQDLGPLAARIETFKQAIQTGVFPPATHAWFCNPNYCEFYSTCRYVR